MLGLAANHPLIFSFLLPVYLQMSGSDRSTTSLLDLWLMMVTVTSGSVMSISRPIKRLLSTSAGILRVFTYNTCASADRGSGCSLTLVRGCVVELAREVRGLGRPD